MICVDFSAIGHSHRKQEWSFYRWTQQSAVFSYTKNHFPYYKTNHINIFYSKSFNLCKSYLPILPVLIMHFRFRWRAAAKRSTMTEKLNEKMNNISKSFRKVTISHQDLRRTSSTSSTNSKTSTRYISQVFNSLCRRKSSELGNGQFLGHTNHLILKQMHHQLIVRQAGESPLQIRPFRGSKFKVSLHLSKSLWIKRDQPRSRLLGV